MKTIINTLVLILFISIFLNKRILAQNCTNMDFETGTLAGWTTQSSNGRPAYVVTPGLDPSVPISKTYSIGVVPPGNPFTGFSGCLDQMAGGDGDWTQLSQSFIVTNANANFLFYVALITQNGGHNCGQNPVFTVSVRRNINNAIVPCSQISLEGSNNGQPCSAFNGWITGNPFDVLNWTPVLVPLQNFLGEAVTINLRLTRCSGPGNGGHGAKAYIESSCDPKTIVSSDEIICPGKQVTLSAPRLVGYNFTWNGPNGFTANTYSVSINQPGTYSVNISNPLNGCQINLEKTIDAVASPTAAFNYTFVPCSPTFSTAVDASSSISVANDAISSYTWQWNDATPDDNGVSASHTYNAIGVKNVQLTVKSIKGCENSITQSFTVHPLPNTTFATVDACLNKNIALVNNSNIEAGNITSWQWNFGSEATPNSSNSQLPINLSYSVSGIKTITLTATSDQSCSVSFTQQVTVHPDPFPNYTIVNKCVNDQPVSFDASSSTISSGNNAFYSWSYGENGTVSINNAISTSTYAYANAGTFNTTLTVTSDKGCEKSISKQAVVFEKPIILISNSQACDTKPMTFTAVAQPNSGTVVNWLWDFNNSIGSAESSGRITSFVFPGPDNQNVALIAETDKGCKDVINSIVYVDYVPKPDFTVDKPKGCPIEHVVNFTDNTPAIPGPAQNITWNWIFGDNKSQTNSSNTVQSHTYTNISSSQNALYDVGLEITTDKGCIGRLDKQSFITVYPKPVASYFVNPSPSNVVTPLVYFNNESIDYTKFWWYFGDNSPIDQTNIAPSHFYESVNAATYNTALIVENQYGCSDTALVNVEVGPEFTFSIPNAFTPFNEDGVNDVFIGKGIGIAKYEMWVYDRWGSTVFYTDDISKGWDGKIQGKSDVAKQDVFVWKVKLRDVLSKTHDYVGHVTLLK